MRTKSPLQAEKILQVAARLFAKHRFHEARMEDIAAAAEVGKGTIYRYFPDKESLYLALLSRAGEQVSERLQQELASAVGPTQRLEAIVTAVVGYFDEQPHLFDLIHHAEAMHKTEADFPWQQTRYEMIDLVRGIFAEAAERGEFRIQHPETATLMLLGGLRAVIRFGQRPRPSDLARRIVRNFLHGAAELAAFPASESGPHRIVTAQVD